VICMSTARLSWDSFVFRWPVLAHGGGIPFGCLRLFRPLLFSRDFSPSPDHGDLDAPQVGSKTRSSQALFPPWQRGRQLKDLIILHTGFEWDQAGTTRRTTTVTAMLFFRIRTRRLAAALHFAQPPYFDPLVDPHQMRGRRTDVIGYGAMIQDCRSARIPTRTWKHRPYRRIASKWRLRPQDLLRKLDEWGFQASGEFLMGKRVGVVEAASADWANELTAGLGHDPRQTVGRSVFRPRNSSSIDPGANIYRVQWREGLGSGTHPDYLPMCWHAGRIISFASCDAAAFPRMSERRERGGPAREAWTAVCCAAAGFAFAVKPGATPKSGFDAVMP